MPLGFTGMWLYNILLLPLQWHCHENWLPVHELYPKSTPTIPVNFCSALAVWRPTAAKQLAPAGGTCAGSWLSGAYGPLQPVAVVFSSSRTLLGHYQGHYSLLPMIFNPWIGPWHYKKIKVSNVMWPAALSLPILLISEVCHFCGEMEPDTDMGTPFFSS